MAYTPGSTGTKLDKNFEQALVSNHLGIKIRHVGISLELVLWLLIVKHFWSLDGSPHQASIAVCVNL